MDCSSLKSGEASQCDASPATTETVPIKSNLGPRRSSQIYLNAEVQLENESHTFYCVKIVDINDCKAAIRFANDVYDRRLVSVDSVRLPPSKDSLINFIPQVGDLVECYSSATPIMAENWKDGYVISCIGDSTYVVQLLSADSPNIYTFSVQIMRPSNCCSRLQLDEITRSISVVPDCLKIWIMGKDAQLVLDRIIEKSALLAILPNESGSSAVSGHPVASKNCSNAEATKLALVGEQKAINLGLALLSKQYDLKKPNNQTEHRIKRLRSRQERMDNDYPVQSEFIADNLNVKLIFERKLERLKSISIAHAVEIAVFPANLNCRIICIMGFSMDSVEKAQSELEFRHVDFPTDTSKTGWLRGNKINLIIKQLLPIYGLCSASFDDKTKCFSLRGIKQATDDACFIIDSYVQPYSACTDPHKMEKLFTNDTLKPLTFSPTKTHANHPSALSSADSASPQKVSLVTHTKNRSMENIKPASPFTSESVGSCAVEIHEQYGKQPKGKTPVVRGDKGISGRKTQLPAVSRIYSPGGGTPMRVERTANTARGKASMAGILPAGSYQQTQNSNQICNSSNATDNLNECSFLPPSTVNIVQSYPSPFNSSATTVIHNENWLASEYIQPYQNTLVPSRELLSSNHCNEVPLILGENRIQASLSTKIPYCHQNAAISPILATPRRHDHCPTYDESVYVTSPLLSDDLRNYVKQKGASQNMRLGPSPSMNYFAKRSAGVSEGVVGASPTSAPSSVVCTNHTDNRLCSQSYPTVLATPVDANHDDSSVHTGERALSFINPMESPHIFSNKQRNPPNESTGSLLQPPKVYERVNGTETIIHPIAFDATSRLHDSKTICESMDQEIAVKRQAAQNRRNNFNNKYCNKTSKK
ncbi:hypothetical protein IE077_002586 [Cardiosporidium cionae]|uniref:Uncharacterized protein n=1 Tax=Cardiosporidium cionae TaxID=476202 RepID=A0ABQ7JAH0_9APIC|nr:hypothetical protein IE077_002586 [Cardiosporidium cionae]|eukprot:KAF8820993.1 hypothetical protein IE077_002586 [Cardiosporidium cionae]